MRAFASKPSAIGSRPGRVARCSAFRRCVDRGDLCGARRGGNRISDAFAEHRACEWCGMSDSPFGRVGLVFADDVPCHLASIGHFEMHRHAKSHLVGAFDRHDEFRGGTPRRPVRSSRDAAAKAWRSPARSAVAMSCRAAAKAASIWPRPRRVTRFRCGLTAGPAGGPCLRPPAHRA